MSKHIDTLRLTPGEHAALLSALEREEAAAAQSGTRQHKRAIYHRAQGLTIRLNSHGGESANVEYLVRPRNLSAGGMGFLHGCFVHPGTRCSINLVRLDGGVARVAGSVVRCRCVSGRVHDVGVQFEEALAIEDFVVEREGGGAEGVPDPVAGEYDARIVIPLAKRLLEQAEAEAPARELLAVWAQLGRVLRESVAKAGA